MQSVSLFEYRLGGNTATAGTLPNYFGECVMKRDRRTMLMTVGAAAIAAASGAGAVAAQATDIRGAVTFESGAVVPEGRLEIYLEDPAVQGSARRTTETHVKSDGRSRKIAFSLTPPASSGASPTQRVVARLERADGWLVARGSTQVKAGESVNLTLNTVTY